MTQSTTTDPTTLRLPAELLPSDGRFGCGPSKVRPEHLARLARNHRIAIFLVSAYLAMRILLILFGRR